MEVLWLALYRERVAHEESSMRSVRAVFPLLVAACATLGCDRDASDSPFSITGATGAFARHTSSTPTKPVIVLVHGAFADATSFQELIPLLQEQHYPVVAVQNPLTSLEHYADAVAATQHIKLTGPLEGLWNIWYGYREEENTEENLLKCAEYQAGHLVRWGIPWLSTGASWIGRSTTRSISTPAANEMTMVAPNATQYGKPHWMSCQAMKVENIAISPCAKFRWSIAW